MSKSLIFLIERQLGAWLDFHASSNVDRDRDILNVLDPVYRSQLACGSPFNKNYVYKGINLQHSLPVSFQCGK